ncbi:MAG: sugar ABC transporter permease [Spirochaetaceae bacterium]|nr:sugar ABC transporter permease [Spirochaetaceae bacterium]
MLDKKKITPYLLLTPALLIMLLVVLIPVLRALMMSFMNYDLRRPKDIGFIGLMNYITLFKDRLFWLALLKTVIWVGVGVFFQFFFGFILALLLNRPFRARGIVRAVSMIPWVTPGVLIGLMWRWIYDGNFGVLNDLLMKIGLINKNIPFLSQTSTAFPSVIVTIIWQGIPFFALMLLAGLQGVPNELYEAAQMDGAGWATKLFKITIPSMKNTISVTVLLRIIWVANSVDVIFNMSGGGPAYSTQTLSVYIYNKGNALDLGYASSMAIVMAILLSFIAIPYIKSTFRSKV